MFLKQSLASIGLYVPLRQAYRRLRWPNIVKDERRRFHKMVAFYRQFIAPGDLCFDIGANMGNRIEVFRACGGSVVAVEPQPVCIELLHLLYHKDPQVTLIPKAVGSSPGESELFWGDETTLASVSTEWISQVQTSRRFGDHTWENRLTVPVTTLDHLVETYGAPKFCKIDTEGFEAEVIQGLSSPIDYLSFEFTPEVFSHTRACIDQLETLGAPEFNFSEGESMVLAFEHWLTADELLAYLDKLPGTIVGDIYARFV